MSDQQSFVLYHNPRCSKSRQALQILHDHNIEPKTVEYLKNPPSVSELKSILQLLGCSPRDLMRKSESLYKTLNLDDPTIDDETLIKTMVENPILIERPIVIVDQRQARVGRPPETVLELLD